MVVIGQPIKVVDPTGEYRSVRLLSPQTYLAVMEPQNKTPAKRKLECADTPAANRARLEACADTAARQPPPEKPVEVIKIADVTDVRQLPTEKRQLLALLVQWLYHNGGDLDVQIPCHFSCIGLLGSLVPERYVQKPELTLSGVQLLLECLNDVFPKPVNGDSPTADKAAFANHVVKVVFDM